MKAVVSSLRTVRAAVTTTLRSVPPTRLAAVTTAIVILVAIAVFVPLPTAVQLRDWATSAGAWFPLVFFAAHVVITVFPFPRTAFTLAAGLLFGPYLGIPIAVAASTVSALIAVVLVRAAGWQLSRWMHHPRIEAIDARLRARGWAAVLATRLIPAVPFSVLNYAAGASAVRILPYTLATVVGLLPGTSAVVILGDALTGNVSPLLFVVSLGTASLGIAGLIYEIRSHRRDTRHHADQIECAPPLRSGGGGGTGGAPSCAVGAAGVDDDR
ncbi:TVP38/TMEM64 family protein [Mycobacterium sp. Y57]|uniref:TVP38/TMEM64 family protein n=1 Tax=Mycolicibacterium xanthum TaxID=2796469 RepID=UPI001C8440F8|nr:TVP38/TMEM64 family protein [Mycolicibacterium xanthum]MBX7432903.1 TVP38/TMEM64 family protein [Mycolicibacterium xanthum]